MDSPEEMIRVIREDYGLSSKKVLSVMLYIPREKFVSNKYRNKAFRDCPIPIGFGQTMSQPYTVAFMTDLLNLKGDEKVLEIGTGSGYQAAVLSKLAKEVCTIEIIPELVEKAKKTLKRFGYKNVFVRVGSGEVGWKEKAPFDAILVTAGVEGEVPKELFDQLRPEGTLVAPVGKGYDKTMFKFTKTKKGKIRKEKHGVFHFVPFVKE